MPNSIRNRFATRTNARLRAALTTAGLCASAVMTTAGVAAAAPGDGSGSSDHVGSVPSVTAVSAMFDASETARHLSQSTRGQADDHQRESDAAKGQHEHATSWRAPVSDYTLTAGFADSGSRWAATHSGQDFAVPSGTPVNAVHDGTVVKAGGWGAGDGPAYGNAVVVQVAEGTYTQYAHLSRIDVSVGEQVGSGEQIALSGNTGNSTGPHLHFEVRTTPDYGSAVDPVQFLHSKHVRL